MQVQDTFRLRVGLLGVLCDACFRFICVDPAPLAVPHGVAAKTNKQTSERKIKCTNHRDCCFTVERDYLAAMFFVELGCFVI